MFRHIVSSDAIEIAAPAEGVWEILTDVERYGEWNPFTSKAETNLEIGSGVELYVRLGPLKLWQSERVEAVDPPSLLAWSTEMGAPWLLSARREQRLEALSESSCRYVSTDAFNGLLTPLVVLLFGALIRRGFNAMAVALKERAESAAAAGSS